MRKFYTFLFLSFLLMQINTAFGQATLTTSPYVESFDGIGSGLPTGFGIYTGATTTALGNSVSLTTAATAWNNSTGAFKNFASAAVGASATPAQQSSATNRALGLRQVATTSTTFPGSDPGAAFVFQVNNTTNKTGFKLSFDLQSLDASSGRTTTWLVQYGIGSTPTTFTNANSVTGTLATSGSFGINNITADFGNALDNQSGIVTIRIVTLSATTGSGNRASTGIDNFSLSWTDANSSTPQLSLTDASNNTVSTLTFPSIAINTTSTQSYILNGKNLTNNVSINTTGSGFTVSTDNTNFNTSLSIAPTGGTVNQSIYVKFSPTVATGYNGTLAHTSTGATEKDITLSGQAYDPANLSFDFNSCTNAGAPGSGFTQYSVIGAQTWSCTTFGRNTTNGVNMNGYVGGPLNNEDWLISPKLDLSQYTNFPVLSFWSRGEFSGPSLSLWASTNYDGVSNPDSSIFTWTQLNTNFPPLNNTWTLSDGINLTNYKNTPVYIAFKYTSNTDDGAARWTLDDIAVTNKTQIFSATPSPLYFGEQASGTQSAGKAVTVQSIGYGDVTVNAPASYLVSLDSNTYASSIVIPQAAAQAGTKIFASFAPTSKQLIIADSIAFTNGSDLNTKAVAVSGSSYPKSETFDAGCYNISFFGSTGSSAIVRTPDQITSQINNIATVFQHMNLDIAGFEEMSSDSSLAVMVSQLNSISGQTYAALVSDRYSYYFQAPDPTYPAQKVGILYNTNTMTLSTTEPPRALFKGLYDSIQAGTATLANYPGGTSSSFYASGRLPFMATFTTNINGVNKKIRYIVIHAKSGADTASYNRRQYDALVLKDSIDQYYSNDNVIIVGDYNDRLVGSIATGKQSSYQAFVQDNTHYDPLTYQLDQAGQTSFPGDNGMIDQIIITNPLVPAYLANSTQIEPANTYVSPYNKVVGSDHLPVYTRFALQNIVTPVRLINFSGVVANNAVKLSWTTTSENNSKRFIIQRSSNGSHYDNVGEINAAGTSSITINYQYIDNSPASGVNFYRLIQEDIDGAQTPYGPIRITFTNNNTNGLQVYPNPVNKNSHITIELANASGIYAATLITVNGSAALQTKGTIEDINKTINSNLSQLSAGVYILQVSNGSTKYQTKLIKQ